MRRTKGRSSKRRSAERGRADDADAPVLDRPLEPLAQRLPGDGARRRQQAQDADEVGQEARRQQECARDEDHEPVDQLRAGQAACGQLLLHAAPRGRPLAPRQPRAHERRQHDCPDGRPEPDAPADGHQQRQVHDRHDQEEQEQAAEQRHGQSV